MVGPRKTRDKTTGRHRPRTWPLLTDDPLWKPNFPVIRPMEEEVQRLKEENEKLKRDLARQRATTVRTALVLEDEIRERKRLEEAFFSALPAFTGWIETAPLPMAWIGPDGVIGKANHRLLDLLGHSREELVDHPVQEFLPDPAVFQAIMDAMAGTAPFRNRQTSIRCGSGAEVEVMIACKPLQLGGRRGLWCFVQDLSEVVRHRFDRQNSEGLLRQLTEHIREVFWITTVDKKEMLYVSSAYTALWGRSRESLYENPRSYVESVHPDDRERVERALPHQEDEFEGHQDEYRIVRPDGSIRWIRDRSFPIRNESGEIYRVAGLAEDITVAKEHEERLRQWGKQQQALADLGHAALRTRSRQVLFEEAVTTIAETLGVELATVQEFDEANDRLVPRARVGWDAPESDGDGSDGGGREPAVFSRGPLIVENLAGDERFNRTSPLRKQGIVSGMSVVIEGREHPFGILEAFTREQRCFTADDANFLQAVAHILAAAVERRAAEERQRELTAELAAQRRRLNDILKHIPALVWELMKDSDSGSFKLTYVNEFVETLLGFTKEEYLERPELWLENIHPADREKVVKRVQKIFAGKKIGPAEFRGLARDGRIVWVESNKRPIFDDAGKAIGLRGIVVDITARKLAQIERDAAEKRFRAFMDNSPVVAVMKDEGGHYIYGNKPFQDWCEGLGIDWFGSTDYEIFPEDLAHRYGDLDRECLEKNETTQVIENARDEMGKTRYWSALRFPVEDASGRRVLGIIALDVTERRNMEREILEISDQEQQRLGQELHDGLCQHLLGLALMSKTLADRMAKAEIPQAKDVQTISDFTYEALALARGLMKGFHLVDMKSDGGLAGALEEFSNTTAKLFSKSCDFQSFVRIKVHDTDVATHLFRIAQEATHNAIKHGAPTRVTISLNQVDNDLLLTVENDGEPLPETLANQPGMGIRTMNYRAELIGATLSFANRPGGGVIVTCRLASGRGFAFV